MMKLKKGFTLIELLVVMVIIATLAGMSLFSFQGARKQGRDAKRKADLQIISSALELYRADCNRYPASIPPPPNGKIQANCTGTLNTYLEKVPGDPATGTAYQYSPSGTTRYTLTTTLEDCTTGCTWQVTNP